MSKSIKSRDEIVRTIPKVLYLRQILTRVESEYIKILNLITEHNLTHDRGIGFWSLIRIIFPVIETVARTVGKQKEDFLEDDLKVPYGHLVWELYRHPLMHTDELRYGVYKGKIISWATHLGNEGFGHFVADQTKTHETTIHIHIPSLYLDLKEYLLSEINKNDTSEIKIQEGVHFQDHKSKLLSELEELYSKH